MKLLRAQIIAAETCGGLLDGLNISVRDPNEDGGEFDPVCLVGPNGSGKSQFLQVLAEMFQSVLHVVAPEEERREGNPDLLFELEYLIAPNAEETPRHVRITRVLGARKKPNLTIQVRSGEEWDNCNLSAEETAELLPKKVIGYTSGENETLSLPFLLSRSGYAEDVRESALSEGDADANIPDTRLMPIDYGTHLEVLVANLILGTTEQRTELLKSARLDRLHSFRCIVQLAHSAVPKAPPRLREKSERKGIQLTDELEGYLDRLRRCATCFDVDEKTETYTFDFLVDEQTRTAFQTFWDSSLELYSAFHKLAMLNDLAIPKKTRERFKRETNSRKFATRLPEPQDEDKVFRFEHVNFHSERGGEIVDYVSLSDGEHQLAQLLGTFGMVSYPNVLLLLDEPESHFNPQWRVKFISRLLDLPTANGKRREKSAAARQDCLLTTHAPFLPSDMRRENVLIFSKDQETGRIEVRHPDIETYGTTFDSILEECFGVRPPISQEPRDDIEELMKSTDPDEIKAGMDRLGHSVEKIMLADRYRQLTKNSGT